MRYHPNVICWKRVLGVSCPFVQRVTRKNDGIDGALIGANASAEELEEGTEEGTVTDVDIILNHNLQPSAFTKKSYQIYVKDYMKS